MKLCLLNYEYPPIGAGAASATQEIANSLVRQGHTVTVVTAGFGEAVGQCVERGVRVIRLRCRRSKGRSRVAARDGKLRYCRVAQAA
jgi:hypothetical protein